MTGKENGKRLVVTLNIYKIRITGKKENQFWNREMRGIISLLIASFLFQLDQLHMYWLQLLFQEDKIT